MSKYHEDLKNKELIKQISSSLHEINFKTTVIARDYEKWGKLLFIPKKHFNYNKRNNKANNIL